MYIEVIHKCEATLLQGRVLVAILKHNHKFLVYITLILMTSDAV